MSFFSPDTRVFCPDTGVLLLFWEYIRGVYFLEKRIPLPLFEITPPPQVLGYVDCLGFFFGKRTK